jgi:hypothetical protein
MFGLGGQEILLLLLLVGVLVVSIVVRLLGSRSGSRVAQLEDENRRLREELERRRGG